MNKDFLESCMEIGAIAESSWIYTDGLERKIEATGKRFEDLTVGELIQLHREHNDWFNKTYTG